ncbi:hypothetical protein [Paraburkholderia sp.]|uniref:hypothetical protein n=1 Tax=Paraburkholderia sp. TaxID=1926495 RepID=UPI003C7C304B
MRHELATTQKMPKRKLPVVSIDGQLIADTSFIIEELQHRYPEALNDSHLSALENAQSVAFRSLFEINLYFGSIPGRRIRYSPAETMHDSCARVPSPSAKLDSGGGQWRAGVAGEEAFQSLPCCGELMPAYERQLLVV